MTSRLLLGRSRFLDEASTKSSAFNDPGYLPVYYHLAGQLETEALVQIGVDLGLAAACFAQGSPGLTAYLGLQPPTEGFFSTRFARGNIRDHTKAAVDIRLGGVDAPGFLAALDARSWGLGLLTEESTYESLLASLEALWRVLPLGGLVAMEFVDRHPPCRRAFEDFCKVRNRDGVVLRTRYGLGIVQK